MKRILALMFTVFFFAACENNSSNGPDDDTTAAFDFALTDIDGNPHTLSHYDGKVIVLNFFATWCAPCQIEMPQLESNIWQVYQKDVVVLGIDLKEDLGTVKLFAVNNGLTFPVAVDNTGDIFRSYAGGDAVTNVPYNVIIDKNQKIRYSQTGYNENEMKSLIETLIQ